MGELTQSYRDFYSTHGNKYWEITEFPEGERYTQSSNPKLKNDGDLIRFMMSKLPDSARGLDAGCGPGGRDVVLYQNAGFDLFGIDAVEENIVLSKQLSPELDSKFYCIDIGQKLPFADGEFDFLLCNCVIQHIIPEKVHDITLVEFSRVLKPGGLLQLMFKTGRGETTVHDPEYNVQRHFNLYQTDEICNTLANLSFNILPEVTDDFGGVIHFLDPKPMPHSVLFAQKSS